MPNPTPSPMEQPDAARLVRALQREVEARADGRADIAPFVAWLRTRLDVLASELTPAHRSRTSQAKPARADRALN